jgi:hypothetical protein
MRTIKVNNLYGILRTDKKTVYKISEMVIDDDKPLGEDGRLIYRLNNGTEVISKDCFTIKIPTLDEFNQVLEQYPDALDNGINYYDRYNSDFIKNEYAEKNREILIRRLNCYQQEVKDIKKQLGIIE